MSTITEGIVQYESVEKYLNRMILEMLGIKNDHLNEEYENIDQFTKIIRNYYNPTNYDYVIITYDNEQKWSLISLFYAILTKRNWYSQEEYNSLKSRPNNLLFIGSPNINQDIVISDQTPFFLTASTPLQLLGLLDNILNYEHNEQLNEANILIDYSAIANQKEKINPEQLDRAREIFITAGHSGPDYLAAPQYVISPPIDNFNRNNKQSYQERYGENAIPINKLRAKHLVLLGCRTFNLGLNPYGVENDLAIKAIDSGAITYIGGYDYIDIELPYILFLNALFRSGLKLGECMEAYSNCNKHNDLYNAPLKCIGEPSLRFCNEKKYPIFEVDKGENVISLPSNVWLAKCILRNTKANETNITIKQKYFILKEECNDDLYIWIFNEDKLEAGDIKLTIDKIPNNYRLYSYCSKISQNMGILQQLKIIKQDLLPHVKTTKSIINELQISLNKTDTTNVAQTISTLQQSIFKLQEKIVKKQTDTINKKVYNPLSLYDNKKLYYIKNNKKYCAICKQNMSESIIFFPATPNSERLRTQCINCDVMEEKALHLSHFDDEFTKYRNELDDHGIQNQNIKVSTQILNNKININVKARNYSYHEIPATFGIALENSNDKGVKFINPQFNTLLIPNKTNEFNMSIEIDMDKIKERQLFVTLIGLVDLEWFYYCKAILIKNKN